MDNILKKIQMKFDNDSCEPDFVLGNSVSKGIPWSDFSEIEIQGILKMHFERLGFKVTWRHCDDPANEKGIDLECTHKKNHKKIIIAVKKKPKVNDLGQVLQLSQHDADRRIYLYINGAAQSFRDQIVTFESTIEFWDEKAFEKNLDESRLAIWLKIDNSFAIRAINSINNTIFTTIKNASEKPVPKPNRVIFETLWDLKDRAVTLSKCATLIQFMFEDSSRFGKMSYQEIQELQIWCLDFLYTNSLISIIHSFDSLSTNFKITLMQTHENTNGRSNWYMLKSSIRPEFIPGNIENLIRHKIHNSDTGGESQESEKPMSESRINEIYFYEASNQFRLIGVWADGFEYTINDIFERCLIEAKIK